jgi:hypothetical protein
MSETATQETPVVDVQVPATGPAVSAHDSAGAESQPAKSPGAEAAKYRVQRNEAREALTEASGRIEALQVREVERLASEHLAQPADLLSLGGVSLADLVTPEGYVDHEAVAEAAAAVIDSRPGLARNPKVRATDLSQGMGGGGAGQPNWGDLFRL